MFKNKTLFYAFIFLFVNIAIFASLSIGLSNIKNIYAVYSITIITFAGLNALLLFHLDRIFNKTTNNSSNFLQDMFGGYSKQDVKEITNLTAGFKDMMDLLQDPNTESLNISIAALSNLWSDEVKKPVKNNVSEADIWKLYLSESVLKDSENIFVDDEINEYFNNFKNLLSNMAKTVSTGIYNDLKNDIITVIVLLKLLDQQGDCKSVVQSKRFKEQRQNQAIADTDKDPDISKAKVVYHVNLTDKTNGSASSTKDLSQYDLLAKVTLKSHSIHVAKNIEKILSENGLDGTILVPAVIAALAHDIGKIPKYYDASLYTTHMHPSISVELLKRVESFSKIPEKRRNFIIDAIKNHHSNLEIKSESGLENPISVPLKEADAMAREQEIDSMNVGPRKDKYALELDWSDKDIFSDKLPDNSQPEQTDVKPLDSDEPQESNANGDAQEQQQEQNQEGSQSSTEVNETQESDSKENGNVDSSADNQQNNQQNGGIDLDKYTITSIELKNEPKQSILIKPKGDPIEKVEIDCITSDFIRDVLKEVQPLINIVEKTSLGKDFFAAFTYRNSVFIRVDSLKKIYLKLFEKYNCEELANILKQEQDQYEENKSINKSKRSKTQSVMLAIADKFYQNGLQDVTQVKPNFFSGPFIIYNNQGVKEVEKARYYVFKGDIFEESYEDLEQRKSRGYNQVLKKIIGKVTYGG